MLMMSRREGEVILIGDDIEILITHIGRSRVKVGIKAPRSTPVIARELKLVQDENRAAAEASPDRLSTLLEKFQLSVKGAAARTDKGSDRQEADPKN